ncbi:MAG: GDP-mannose 4,6-dehydratase [Planctomycetes bacterium]|nr:GDP-mannose 4,6-dehydratase [Planctomycetota bacterium]
MKRALITGITGQDGSYLTELLLEKKYEVHGIVRRSSTLDRPRLAQQYRDESVYGKRLFLHYADLSDVTSIRRIVQRVAPDEFYHLAGQSHVGLSFEIPESTCELTAIGTLRILEILRDQPKPPRFVHASSREIFGTPTEVPQNERTPMNPNSPYGVAKAFATQMVKIYREAHGLFFCNAICYNHESPRRSENFVTRKISLAAARIKLGLQRELMMGSIDSARDWGYAAEYVEAMWRMLQQEIPDDYILATGQTHSVREFLHLAFDTVGLDWQNYYRLDPRFGRPADPENLLGDPTHAYNALGWKSKTTLGELARLMVEHDLDRLKETGQPR